MAIFSHGPQCVCVCVRACVCVDVCDCVTRLRNRRSLQGLPVWVDSGIHCENNQKPRTPPKQRFRVCVCMCVCVYVSLCMLVWGSYMCVRVPICLRLIYVFCIWIPFLIKSSIVVFLCGHTTLHQSHCLWVIPPPKVLHVNSRPLACYPLHSELLPDKCKRQRQYCTAARTHYNSTLYQSTEWLLYCIGPNYTWRLTLMLDLIM